MHAQLDPLTSGAVRLAVDFRQYPGIRRLAADYAYAFDNLREFFAGNPTEPEAWRTGIDQVQAHPRNRDALAEALSAQQQRRGAPPEARASVDRLRDSPPWPS